MYQHEIQRWRELDDVVGERSVDSDSSGLNREGAAMCITRIKHGICTAT